jgi:hypothetical protein
MATCSRQARFDWKLYLVSLKESLGRKDAIGDTVLLGEGNGNRNVWIFAFKISLPQNDFVKYEIYR